MYADEVVSMAGRELKERLENLGRGYLGQVGRYRGTSHQMRWGVDIRIIIDDLDR